MENSEKKPESGGAFVQFLHKLIKAELNFLHLSTHNDQIMYLIVPCR